MKNFYHYLMAMLYLKLAHRTNSDKQWWMLIEKSLLHANQILKSLEE